jgi:tripartite-type tricarboxylate transporter receptor subunit TctC
MISVVRSTAWFAAALAAFGFAGAAFAQDYPQRPITFVVGFGAGGGTDINARIFAEAISRNIGQRIVVDNRTGAGGAIAAITVQQAEPDGYTLLVISGLQHAYLPATQSAARYEPIKGFAPITTFFEMISVLAVPTGNPATNVKEFIEYARNKPGGVTVGSPGVGSPPHLFGALIAENTGVPVQAVQYRGSTPIMADLAGSRIDFAFPTYGLAQSFVAEKKARALAVAADARWSELPDLPTLVEAKLVKEMPAMWFGVVAPAGTPAPIVKRINDEFAKAAKDPEVIKKINATGMAVRISTPQQMRDLMVAESARINALVERLKLKQD